jgi:4-amino-4-deoxy-L-arabinose transferase-like glycosyltransferase
MTRTDRLVAAALFAGTLAVTVATAHRQGINRDEAYYMVAGEQYITYFERLLRFELRAPLSDGTIGAYWSYNHEHPPLMKVLYGLSWRLFHTCRCAEDKALHPGIARLDSGRHVTLPLFDLESTAFRLPTMICFALLAALVYLFFVEAFGGRTGALAAALLTVLQPRAFFHAETAGFDLPAAFFWVATTFAWWRALASPRRTAGIWVGVLAGLFLATKLQSFFLPVALGLHWLVLLVVRRRAGAPAPTIWPIVWMALLAPLIFFASWPWLWHDPIHRIGAYLAFHLTHVHYNFEYLGTNYYHPPYPWHEPLGMLVTTAPVVLLALAAAGAVVLARSARRDPRATGTLLLLSAFIPVVVFFRGTTPIFGETKHWLATMPFLAMAAGVAVEALAQALKARTALCAALVVVAAAPAAVETARSHPYGLSHYNALAGGAPGGADLGMNRQFWGYSVLGLMDWLNAHLPARAKLYLHDWNRDAYLIYLRERRLRADVQDADMEEPGVRASDAALVIHEKHFAKYEYMIWAAYGTVRPAEVLTLDGVPLVTVYTRP